MSQQNPLDFDSLWDYSNPEQTESKFREILLQIAEKDPAHLELLTQVARTQGLQRKFDEAHQTLDQVEKVLDENPSRAKVRYLLGKASRRGFLCSGRNSHAGDHRFARIKLNVEPASHSNGRIFRTGKSAGLARFFIQQYGLVISRHG
jgi:hypothetical protein